MYEVAFLLGTTLDYVENEMSHKELSGWFNYFERRPPGWQSDQRTAMLVNALGAKKRPEELFPSLRSMKQAEQKHKEKHSGFALQFMDRFGHKFPELKVSK